ncbi:hypothetical protein KJ562_00205 [Patescibacteria group bacterium]|nr:hypothetical protein [Patescibacteria group bacterium]MBU4162372.1 hypothetical protein [Patescibacteria group bacterium]
MNKATKILIIGLFLGLFVFVSQASAAGIVPCGQREDDPNTTIVESAPCTLCHFFVLIEVVLEFVFFNITPPLALLMLIIGGGMFMMAAGDPGKISKARTIITTTLIGIVIIYGAFFLVGMLLQSINLADPIRGEYESWWTSGTFNINCHVPGSTPALPPAPVVALPTATAFIPPMAPAAMPIIIPIAQTFSGPATVITFP